MTPFMNKDSLAELAAEIGERLRCLRKCNAANVRAVRREHSKQLAREDPETIVALALLLRDQPGFEHRFVGYELVSHHRGALASLRAKHLTQLGRGLDSWFAVDAFACYLAGPAWREKQIPDSLIHRWAKSKDRWWRRTALVCTVPLNNKTRGGSGDAARTLSVCRLLLADRDDMVVKAMSWALRELAKRDPDSVREFLSKHENELAKRVLREVRNKLKTGLKNPQRK